MCGVFVYTGPRTNAHEMALKGLKGLEYRGYDSWGICFRDQSQNLKIYKATGHITNVEASDVFPAGTQSNLALGHTRWATHGGVTVANAHPHSSAENDVVVIHNGIFENYLEVKQKLELEGFEFKSETDTEVAAHLIHKHLKTGASIETAFREALNELEGRYALVAVFKNDNNKIFAARRGSPLIIGVNEDQKEYFLASDVPAFLEYTNNVMYLDDEQMAVICPNEGIKFYNLQDGNQIEKRIITVDLEHEEAEKGDHPHFMIKEIWEQKETILRAVNQDKHKLKVLAKLIKDAYGSYLIGCGTAGKVCLAGTYLFAEIAKKHVNFTFGSEFGYFKDFIEEGSLLISVSQSGETADVLEAMEIAKEKGATLATIINVESSTMARLADITVPIKAGPEKAVASTKATTSQLAILTLLAYATADQLEIGEQLLLNTAREINDMLNPRYEEHILELAKKIVDQQSMYIIGRGVNYPIALEAAIKLQEVSYIHAEGFAGGELKHGPLALISEGTPVIAITAKDKTYKDIISNATEIKARGGYIIGIGPEKDPIFDYWIKVPDVGITSPIINIIPIQILSYHLAVLRNNNPDKPRNLAKSVTVK